MNEYEELVSLAMKIRLNAYAPYSKFRVGAAVLARSGEIFTGVNVENVSYGVTICAERVAICNAISGGERKIKAIAIASDSEDYIYPCGACRQFISEFADMDSVILCCKNTGEYKVFNVNDLMPHMFNFKCT